jgi:hypothetical protein
MARRKRGKVKTVLVLCVLGLAAFGGYVLWDKYNSDVRDTASEMSDKAQKVKKVLSD